MRFQVSLPTPHAAVGGYFGDTRREWPLMLRAYETAIVADIARMVEGIPAEGSRDPVGLLHGNLRHRRHGLRSAVARRTLALEPTGVDGGEVRAAHGAPYIAPLSAQIPEDVLLGYHICLGTWPQVPFASARDLNLVVRAANAIVKNTPRRIDFLHLPVVPTAGA